MVRNAALVYPFSWGFAGGGPGLGAEVGGDWLQGCMGSGPKRCVMVQNPKLH